MAYSRTDWVSGETPLSAENMNNIEDGIEECKDGINDLNSKYAWQTTGGTTGSIAAGGTGSVTYNMPKSGYVPIGIIGIRKAGGGSGMLAITGFSVDPSTNQASVSFYNNHTSALSGVSVFITVLYVAQ